MSDNPEADFAAEIAAAAKRKKKRAVVPPRETQTTQELRAEMAIDVAAGEFANPSLLDDAATSLPPMIEEAESKAKTVNARRMGMTYRQMRARNLPPPEFLIAGLVPREGVGALSGEPKAAKSWDATYYAVCVAAGLPVYGKHAVQRPARVFYYYAEDTEAAVNNRVAAIAACLNLDLEGSWVDRLVMQPRGRPLDVLNTAQLCVLAASVRDFERSDDKFALLVLDPLSNIHSGEEDKRDSMVKVMARLHALEQYLGLAVLFIHHSGKENKENKSRTRGGQKMRGSSAIHGAVDFGIYLSNLRGDSKNEFVARVESEMKAARGAGVFDRTLKIEDNDKGNAIRARFESAECVEETKLRESSRQIVEDRAVTVVAKLFEQGGPLTFDQLKSKIGGGTAPLTAALEAAETAGWIARRIHNGRKAGYEITDAGRELYRDGRPADGTADPPAA